MMNGEALIKLPVEYDCSSGGSIIAIGCRGYVGVNVVRRWQWQSWKGVFVMLMLF
jgi:hypothetical protein